MTSALPTGKDRQFYAMLGTRGIWHEGWFANTVHAASPAGWSNFDKDRWELFHIEADRSQCHDLAAENPDKLEELKALWFSEAEKYNGLPLSDLNILETLSRWRPYLTGTRESYSYYAGTADVGMGASAEIQGRSFVVIAEVTVDSDRRRGRVVQARRRTRRARPVHPGRAAALHLQLPRRGGTGAVVTRGGSAGQAHIRCRVHADRERSRAVTHPWATRRSSSTTLEVAARSGVKIHPGTFGLAGATLSVGRNTGSPVSRAYKAPFAFTGGTIAQVNVDVSGKPYANVEREFARAFAKD